MEMKAKKPLSYYLIIAAVVLSVAICTCVLLSSCASQRGGCPSHRGMSGY